jgi:hypothetical protein
MYFHEARYCSRSLSLDVISLENAKMNVKLPDSDRRKGHDLTLSLMYLLCSPNLHIQD